MRTIIAKDESAYKYCLDKYIELKKQDEEPIFDKQPIKKYEIYKLKDGSEKLMLINTEYLGKSWKKELYYDKQIAIEIYNIMLQLEENIENSFPELMELCQEEIIEKQEKIEELRKKDEQKYQEAVNVYNLMKKSGILQTVQNNLSSAQNENFALKEKIENNSNLIKDLSKKLQIALNKVEELQNRRVGLLGRIAKIFKKAKKLTDGN